MALKMPNDSALATYIVRDNVGDRLDVWLTARLSNYSRAKLAQFIKSERVLVNQQPSKAGYRVRAGDYIEVYLLEPEAPGLEPEPMNLSILYEDEYFLAINKPPGLVVHPGAGNRQGTLVHGLLHYTKYLSTVGGADRPGLVHRLDKDTSGVLLVAKSDEAHWRLSELFKQRAVYKEYWALVWGCPNPTEGIIDAALHRSPNNRQKFVAGVIGRPARTRYWVREDFGEMAFVHLQLETGRTHQARVHLQYIGNPVVGDVTYGGGKRNLHPISKERLVVVQKVITMVTRQMLHAVRIRFKHPWNKQQISIEAPLPADFAQVLNFLRSMS